MAKPDNRFQALAEEAAERLIKSRQVGEQIDLLPPDPAQAVEPAKGGRGRARAKSGLKGWLDAQGYRDPAQVLAEVAGLASQHDAFTTAMLRTEQLEAFMGEAMKPAHRLATFMQVFSAQVRAAEAVMPYVAGKVDKPAPTQLGVQVFTGPAPAPASSQPGDGARVVNPAGATDAEGVRFAPPPMPGETKQNQGLDE
ncbi:hypothetical protein [Pararhodobacter sp.]|uniref:hypothetical protein n=1 Tax=Pararhodobacter sp. TaxID=2127056 RepID=UPI002FDD9120